MADEHLLEGPVADRWRSLSEEVQRARQAGLAAGPNDGLLAQARQEDSGLAGPFVLWAGDSLVAEARFDEAILLYAQVGEHEPVAGVAELDVRSQALKSAAEAHVALDDVDGALEDYARLAESKLPGASQARALLELGRVAAGARRDDDAKKAFQRVAKLKDKSLADLAQRALTRLDVGGAVARPSAEALAAELAGALRRRDGRALRRLASPSHFSVALGTHFHFANPTEIIDRLEPDLFGSTVRCDHRRLSGCGPRQWFDSDGWVGESFAGTVRFTVERTRDGWEWTGISPLAPPDVWVKDIVPDKIATNQPLSISIKAPWPAGIRMRAGGLWAYIGEQVSIVHTASIPLIGPPMATVMTLGYAARDCGFGPGGLYYNMQTTHVDTVEQDAFAIDFLRYLQFVPYANVGGGTPILCVAPGLVTRVDAGVVSGDSSSANRVHVRHVTMGAIVLNGRLVTVTINTPYVSHSLHLAGPNMIPVSVGMFVRQGARLGLLDDTGNSAYNHLHFAIHDDRVNNGGSVRPTPMDGQTLEDWEDSKCILSSNMAFP